MFKTLLASAATVALLLGTICFASSNQGTVDARRLLTS